MTAAENSVSLHIGGNERLEHVGFLDELLERLETTDERSSRNR